MQKTTFDMQSARGTACRSRKKGFFFGVVTVFMLLAVCLNVPVHAEAKNVEVGIPVEEHPELFLTRSMPTRGEGKIAVFLIDFPDCRNDNTAATVAYYEDLYFNGGVENKWDTISVAEFYRQESYGKLNLSGCVFDWYTAQHERSYYDERKAELIEEAAEYYRARGVDFSDFDGDGDGVMDAVVYHFAGESMDERNSPWYSGLCIAEGGTVGDMKFTTMVQIREGASLHVATDMVGVACHELMHTLGMPDLYSELRLMLIPTNDLMGENERTVNPYIKIMLGWIDTVQVITEDTDNVRLDLYSCESAGDVAIVTDTFNGFFDEFYLIAYRKYARYGYQKSVDAVVWHIDARLNEDKTAFAYQNLYYTPDTASDYPHQSGYVSKYPFIEELSSDPAFNFVLDTPLTLDLSAFREDSCVGPNRLPSSDTHDGGYTGIQIDRFVKHGEEYATFDVSFVKDTLSPAVTTKEEELAFADTVKIHFNEYVYAGESWEDILVTDLDGNRLDAAVTLSQYPRFEVKITFRNAAYENGYKIVFPKGAVQDSSKNSSKAQTLTASPERHLFPTSSKKLPDAKEYIRDNSFSNVYFFLKNENLTVITPCWKGQTPNAVIEIMHLDSEGNVLRREFMDNPFCDDISAIIEMGEGEYVAFCPNDMGQYDRMFCFDGSGTLLWTNDTYSNSGEYLWPYYGDGNGIVAACHQKDIGFRSLVYIWSDTGEIKEFTGTPGKHLLPGKELLLLSENEWDPDTETNRFVIKLVDIKTGETVALGELPLLDSLRWTIQSVQCNDDGTMMVFCDDVDSNTMVFLLDIELNVIKSVALTCWNNTGINRINWIRNDGFCEIFNVERGDHSNEMYRVRRYDRCLNLLWVADVEANFIYYVQSPAGNLWAYKSIYEPERECRIEYYGSEKEGEGEHVHRWVRVKEVPSTCLTDGCIEYWYCSECGCRYSDEGKTLITDARTMLLAHSGHSETTDAAVAPTCTEVGLSEGTHCSRCGKILVTQRIIPVLDHSASEWMVDSDPDGGERRYRECVVCGTVLEEEEGADSRQPESTSVVLLIAGGLLALTGIAVATLKKKARKSR